MKKLVCIVIAFTLAFSAALMLTGCKDEPSSPPPSSGTQTPGGDDKDPTLKDITGVTFANATFTYDGSAHSITVSGTLPEGAHVEYTANTATDAGTYNASAVITCEGYNAKTLSATLTVQKATLSGIEFEDKTVRHNGELHSIQPTGNIPQSATVKITYDGNAVNGVKDAGAYNVKLTITDKNYNTFEKTATLRIISVTAIAQNIVDSLLVKPDPWDFMPEGLQPENMAYSSMPASDFTNFVQISNIGKRAIGRQLNVLYDGLLDASNLLGYVNNVYAVGTAIASAYQTFINSNPDDYAEFTGEIGGFKVLIKLDGDDSILLAGNSLVSVELYNHGDDDKRTGRIQLTDGMALKYESTEDSLKMAVKKTVKGVGSVWQVEFVRSAGAVAGVMYEYTGTENTDVVKSSATITFNENVSLIVSDKRDARDLKVNCFEEAYDSKTGNYLGGEVVESNKYDTLWFMLGDVTEFKSVKAEDKQNYLNPDTLYLNGLSSSMHTSGLTSRNYDVEMRDVWYLTKTVTDGKTEYVKTKTEIPMLFVQKKYLEDFGANMKKENSTAFTGNAPALPQGNITLITAYFPAMQETYLELKELGSRDTVEQFIGEKNALFQKTEQ